jgi:GNAT superfamily N-acetyltransferase
VIVYSIEPLNEDVERAFARLFPEEREEKSAARLRWRFRDAAHGQGWFSVARRDHSQGEIVGIVGVTAARMWVAGKSIDAYQAVDLVVDPGCRGQGLFREMGGRLLAHAADQGRKLVWGFPNPNAAPAWFGRFGWQRFGSAPFMIRPLRAAYLVKRVFGRSIGPDVPLARASPTTRASMRLIDRFGPYADRLWEQFRRGEGCCVERDASWLNWRLVDRPQSAYRTIGDFDEGGQLRAFVSSSLLDKHDGRILYIMEAMSGPSDTDRLVELLRHEIATGVAKGADVALCWCPTAAASRRAFRRAGFLPFPDRLRPVAIHFGAKLLADDLPDDVRRADRWYVSYLDSDTV